MPVLDVGMVETYALRAGWGARDAIVAAAVAMAESGGNTDAHATKGEDSRGLWQMNVQAHPELAGRNLYDPGVNAAAAYNLWKAKGWGPWSAHNNGTYLAYMLQATAASPSSQAAANALGSIQDAGNVLGGAVDAAQSVAQGALGAAQSAVGFLQDLQNPELWQRIGKVIVGGVLIAGGLFILVKSAAANLAGGLVGDVAKSALKK